MAEKAGHCCFEELKPQKIDSGTGKLQLVTNGKFNAKYKITTPNELEDYEGYIIKINYNYGRQAKVT